MNPSKSAVWIESNDDGLTKAEHQEAGRRAKQDAHDEVRASVKLSYRIYRRAGLKPLCAIRFLLRDALSRSNV